MQGSIAQIIALTTYGNAVLQGELEPSSIDLYAQNSSFKFCESVRFLDHPRGFLSTKQTVLALDVQRWFDVLRKTGARALRMSYGPSGGKEIADRMLVGFVGGGGKWLVESYAAEKSAYWESRWQLGDRDRVDKRIWRVDYERIASDKPPTNPGVVDMEELKKTMRLSLEEMANFSRSQNLDWFTKAFDGGIARLDAAAPLEGLYHADIAPPGFLPLSANQLLGSVQAAWVFGGMGSWDDHSPDEPEANARYHELSERFYQLLNRVIVAAANSGVRSKK
jgi:hypothetical protein